MMKKIIIVPDVMAHNRKMWDDMDKGLYDIEKGMMMTPDTFAKIFTPERIRLLQRIRKNKIKNIYQLAKELGKPYEVVFKNIKYFEGFGLVTFDKNKKNKVPVMTHEIKIDMFPKIS
jgi:predicted transcriptional regulator